MLSKLFYIIITVKAVKPSLKFIYSSETFLALGWFLHLRFVSNSYFSSSPSDQRENCVGPLCKPNAEDLQNHQDQVAKGSCSKLEICVLIFTG